MVPAIKSRATLNKILQSGAAAGARRGAGYTVWGSDGRDTCDSRLVTNLISRAVRGATRLVSGVDMGYSTLLLFCGILCVGGAGARVPTLRLHDGRDIPALALGTWLGNNTKPGEHEVERAVTWALEAGYSHVDTAFVYRVEDQVGRALAAKINQGVKREDLFITTKLWNDAHARDAVVPALRRSLASLQLEYVDLYLIHWPVGQFDNQTYDYTDYVETWRGMMEARRLGLARSIGVSNFNQQQVQRLLDTGLDKPAALQVEINLNLQQPELLAYCREQDIRVMGYTPFGSLFPGKARPDAPPPRVDDPELVAIAANHNKTVPQVVLRYLVELGVIPLPKSLSRSRIVENVAVFDFELTPQQRAALRRWDVAYRTIPQLKWRDHPYYPFEKN